MVMPARSTQRWKSRKATRLSDPVIHDDIAFHDEAAHSPAPGGHADGDAVADEEPQRHPPPGEPCR